MKLKTRDFVSTLLVVLVVVPYVGYLLAGEMPFIEDPRGMAAVGLLLGTVAYVVMAQGDGKDRSDKVEDTVALVAFLLGFTALALAETAAAEVLLAVFMGSLLLAWAMKLVDHAGLLPVMHPTARS